MVSLAVGPVLVICEACDSTLGSLFVDGELLTWRPTIPRDREQRADLREMYPQGLAPVALEPDAQVAPQAYCPNGHVGFDTSRATLRAAAHSGDPMLRLKHRPCGTARQ